MTPRPEPIRAVNAHATITLAYHGLELRCPSANLSEDRPLIDADFQLLAAFSARHQKLARSRTPTSSAGLLTLGHEIFTFLNGPTQFLKRLTDTTTPPLHILFATGRDDTPNARTFLDAPWELLADPSTANAQHWSLREDLLFCPIRRIGAASANVLPPSPSRLSVVFMAAAPRGADNLDYEAEEASILQATKDLGLDLVVEESGELNLLAACVAREKPDVIQISSHGKLTPDPCLLLEDETGDVASTQTAQLASKLAAHHPRLLFLSACETAEANPVLDSLARSLVRSGTPAVLGWAAPVLDLEATLFAGHLYRRLTSGDDLSHALAYARFDLNQECKQGSKDWHLARLYLSPSGGGAIATAAGPRRLLGLGKASKAFLDTKGKQVPVAGELEFVGRRREIQAILREFRTASSERRAGVLIHGLGRQGKSSLAARVARRLEPTHELILMFGRYDAQAILGAFRDRLATAAVTDIVNRYLPEVQSDPRHLQTALTELLEGPCDQQRKDAAGRFTTRPVLLVIDDFEQALEENQSGRHTLKPDFVAPISAVIRAFNNAATESRLLFTSRYQFTLPDGPSDLADLLRDIPLHGMTAHEARKQAGARFRLETADKRRTFEAETDRIIATSQGNPGLQNLLSSLCLEDPALCRRCLSEMEAFQKSGTLPSEEKVRQFLENLAIKSLLALLVPAQIELLRTATLFNLPVPVPVFQELTDPAASEKDLARLVSLGLCEVYEDLYRPQESALAVNNIVRSYAGTLNDEEQKAASTRVASSLFEHWGGESGSADRSYLLDSELTRLALLAPESHILVVTAADTLTDLHKRFEYRQAAALAKEIIIALDKCGIPAPVHLLRISGERCAQVGEVQEAGVFLERALGEIQRLQQNSVVVNSRDHASTLIAYARTLVEKGDPDRALSFYEHAQRLNPPDRDQAVVIGEIAYLRAARGEVDAALQLFQEVLDIVDRLGEKKGRAVTLGEVARLRGDRGEVDLALQLHEECLTIFEGLADKRSRAVTLIDIARIRANRGEAEAALKLYQEIADIFEAIGDERSRAITLGDTARLRARKGELDASLQLHQQELAVYEGLQDKRSRALALGDIANIQAAMGEVETALKLNEERLSIFEGLGEQVGIANSLWSIAQIRVGRQEFSEAAENLIKSYRILLQIGRLEGICYVGLDLGKLLCSAGHTEQGRPILTRSRDGFLQLAQPQNAEYAQSMLDQFPES